MDNNSNIIIECKSEKYKLELNYSLYNFNIVKLRSEIYFTKTLIEKIDNVFDDFNFNDIINSEKINEYDSILNDKNILYIYNESKNQLKNIKNENLPLMEEAFEEIIEEFKFTYNLETEIIPIYNNFEQIFKFTNKLYNNYIYEFENTLLKYINLIINDFEQMLNNQIELKNEYDYYNIEKNFFISVYHNYYNQIANCFLKYKENILKLKDNCILYYSLKKFLLELQSDKRLYFKNIINEYLIINNM